MSVSLSMLQCPHCAGSLLADSSGVKCDTCSQSYPLIDGRYHFTSIPDDYEGSGITSTQDPRTWSVWRRKNFEFFKRELATRASPHKIVLDIGVGPGQFLKLTEGYKSVVGVDFRPFGPVDVVADLTQPLPIKSNSVDIIISSNTFEHLPNTENVLSECYRILKPNGVLLATIPFLMRIHQKPYDYNRYTHYKWGWLCERTGFKNCGVQPLSSPVDVYLSIQRHFYSYLLANARTVKGPRGRIYTVVAKLLWGLERIKNHMFAWCYGCAAPSHDFTEGYALVAEK